MRIGTGYDVHALGECRKLIIGGVTIPHEKGLVAHSDGDVLLHAIMDALLGAMGQGDIGGQFPDTDPAYKNISSLLLLGKIAQKITEQHYHIINLDTTIIAQEPKLAPHIPNMREKIATTLNISRECVNIKATTEEGLGFTGAKQGIAAHAVCLLDENR